MFVRGSEDARSEARSTAATANQTFSKRGTAQQEQVKH